MLLTTKLRSLIDTKILVPWATGAPGVESKADNYLYRVAISEESSIVELILTPFPRQLWTDLWYIKMMSRETKGIVARLSSLMRERKINIVGMDSSTTLQGSYHSSCIALDCRGYTNTADGNHDNRRSNPEARLSQLQDEMVLEFIHDLRFFHPSFPCISIERDLTLWSLERAATESGTMLPEKRVSLQDGYFVIPEKEINWIRGRFQGADECSLVSFDAESYLIRVILFFKNQGIVPLALTFDNTPGAIAALTKALREGGCNILGTRFLSVDEERMFAWIVLDQLEADPGQKEDELVSCRVSQLIKTADGLRKFSPELVPA